MEKADRHLIDLCSRAVAGEAEARQAFEREIVPLVEKVVRRSLRKPSPSATGRCSPAAASLLSAGALRPATPPRVLGTVRRVCRGMVDRLGLASRRPHHDTIAVHVNWLTEAPAGSVT